MEGMVRGPSAEAILPVLLITRVLPPVPKGAFPRRSTASAEAGSAVGTAPRPVPHAQAALSHGKASLRKKGTTFLPRNESRTSTGFVTSTNQPTNQPASRDHPAWSTAYRHCCDHETS